MKLSPRAQRTIVKHGAPDMRKWMDEAATAIAKMSGEEAYLRAALTRLLRLLANSDVAPSDVEAELRAAKDDAHLMLESAFLQAGIDNGLDIAKMMEDG